MNCSIFVTHYFQHSYTFQDLDRKSQATRCVYPLSKSLRQIDYHKYENLEDFEKYKDDIKNPLVQFFTNPRIVDQGVGFLNFLANLYHILELKNVIQRSILLDYLKDRMLWECIRK